MSGLKQLVRAGTAATCRVLRQLAQAERRIADSLSILCYHRVLPRERKRAYFIEDLVVTPECFRAQCRTLRRHYNVLPLHAAVGQLIEQRSSDKPLAVITFDDGYVDNHSYAFPVLKELGLCATFFVIADLVGTGSAPWYDRVGRAVASLARQARLHAVLADCALPGCERQRAPGTDGRWVVAQLKTMQPDHRHRLIEQVCHEAGVDNVCPDDRIMDVGHLTDLVQHGHEVGSHSATHEILPLLSDDALAREVAGSRATVATTLGCPVHSFCYPNGDVDARVAQAVERAGYDAAVTTRSGLNTRVDSRFWLRRWFVHEDRLAGVSGRHSDALFRMEISGLADRVFRRQHGSRGAS